MCGRCTCAAPVASRARFLSSPLLNPSCPRLFASLSSFALIRPPLPGVRRIEAVSGAAAVEYLNTVDGIVRAAAGALKVGGGRGALSGATTVQFGRCSVNLVYPPPFPPSPSPPPPSS